MPDTPIPTPHVDRVVSKIVVPSEQSMVALLGSRDEVLRTVERVLLSDVHVRGGWSCAKVSSVMLSLSALLES